MDLFAGFEAVAVFFDFLPMEEAAGGAFFEGFPELLVVAFLQLELAESREVAAEKAGISFELPGSADQAGGSVCYLALTCLLEGEETVGQVPEVDFHGSGEAGPEAIGEGFDWGLAEEVAPVALVFFAQHRACVAVGARGEWSVMRGEGFAERYQLSAG